MKVASGVAVVPTAFVATMRQWYVVPGARPAAAAEMPWLPVTAIASEALP